MKILLCHLTLSMGPLEENLKILERAVQIAGEVKADWVITPETAVQGYHFYKIDPEQKLDPQPAEYLTPLRNLVRKNRQYLFLGAGEAPQKPFPRLWRGRLGNKQYRCRTGTGGKRKNRYHGLL